jgi:hypothetical protein
MGSGSFWADARSKTERPLQNLPPAVFAEAVPHRDFRGGAGTLNFKRCAYSRDRPRQKIFHTILQVVDKKQTNPQPADSQQKVGWKRVHEPVFSRIHGPRNSASNPLGGNYASRVPLAAGLFEARTLDRRVFHENRMQQFAQ